MFTSFSFTGCSLELLKPGEKGIIISCKTQDEGIRKKLISMGIKTGNSIILEQQFPSLIVIFNNISMTIDRQTARAIYVRLVDA
ncbi:FeoA family protein [Anabaena cylindrica UHCC 0172]|uniref:FeoA family protein n=1 Tax=Anabaena cylindrica TaxID=1165 RepID=UPI002B1F8B71|nr:FeoA family protein [Anabaena cylindrica]MEA5550602.1 FeoA family protein [Anabaena cylindrica UHCC 0172]